MKKFWQSIKKFWWFITYSCTEYGRGRTYCAVYRWDCSWECPVHTADCGMSRELNAKKW